jgi:quercetin dioxygenase-like cupin family protein
VEALVSFAHEQGGRRIESSMERIAPMTIATESARMQHVYDFATLDRVPSGPTSARVAPRRLLSGDTLETAKSSTIGAALFGEHLIMALAGQARGSGAKAHTHPNEQFNLILQGTMLADIAGDRVFAPAGTLQHTPTLVVHTGVACPDEDLVFLAMKDTRHGIVGPPVDGKHDGPLYLPGFGKRAAEPCLSTAQTMEESARKHAPARVRYVYPLDALASGQGPDSAKVEWHAKLPLAPDARGALVSGERLHIGLIELPARGVVQRHRHGSEQFIYVLRGTLDVEMDGSAHRVAARSAIHVPAEMAHEVTAGAAGTHYLVLKNKTYGIEPVAS